MPTPDTKTVHVVPSDSLSTPSTGQTSGMTRKPAITNLASICGSIMLASPHSASAVHHHGSQDTIVYAVRGRGAIVSEGGNKRQELKAGDWGLIPAFAEHQEVNDGDEEVEWVIVRGGREAEVVNLEGWGKST